MHWPWKRFESLYNIARKRELIDRQTQRRDEMINALWANSNYDQDGVRAQAIESIQAQYEEAVFFIHTGKRPEEEIDESNEFFAAAERGLNKAVGIDYEKTGVTDTDDYYKVDQG